MKKNLLIAIFLALSMSFLFSECCPGGKGGGLGDNGDFWITFVDKKTKHSVIGTIGLFPVKSVVFTNLDGSKLDNSIFSIDDYGEINYSYIPDPRITPNNDYKGGFLAKFPIVVPWNPFSGVTDTIRFNYSISEDRCLGAVLDNFKIYYNDSLYYQGVDTHRHFKFSK